MEHKEDRDINCNWCDWVGTEAGGPGNKRMSGDGPG